jgi:hypothetical protein
MDDDQLSFVLGATMSASLLMVVTSIFFLFRRILHRALWRLKLWRRRRTKVGASLDGALVREQAKE